MEEILEAIRRVVVFILVYRIVLNLFSQSAYGKFFQFFEGIMVIILLVTPLFSWFGDGNMLEQCLEKNWLEVETEWDERELEIIGEKREDMLRETMLLGEEEGYEE